MQSIQNTIISILRKYDVRRASLFGSYARGDFDEHSDVDILVEPPKHMGLGFIRLHQELEDTLQKKVDLLCFHGVNKYLQPHILQHQQSIL